MNTNPAVNYTVKKVALFFLLVVFLAACRVVSEAPARAPTATTPFDEYALLREAESAFQTGDFDQAYQLAQQAVATSPSNATAWEFVRQAAIAKASDDYLRRLPDSRYRLSPENFLADQVNGKSYFIV